MRGETADSGFSRVIGTAALTLQGRRGGVRVEATRALADEGTPAYELPLLGGPPSPLVDQSLLSQRLAFPLMPSGALVGRRVETVRASLTGTLQPFAWWGRTRDTSPHWLRVVGLEATSVTGPGPIARLPGVQLLGGVAYSFDDPLRKRTRGYFSVVFTP